MPCYRFRFFDSSGGMTAGHFAPLDDDKQARAHAEKLLAQNGHAGVEVSGGDHRVYHAERRRRDLGVAPPAGDAATGVPRQSE